MSFGSRYSNPICLRFEIKPCLNYCLRKYLMPNLIEIKIHILIDSN